MEIVLGEIKLEMRSCVFVDQSASRPSNTCVASLAIIILREHVVEEDGPLRFKIIPTVPASVEQLENIDFEQWQWLRKNVLQLYNRCDRLELKVEAVRLQKEKNGNWWQRKLNRLGAALGSESYTTYDWAGAKCSGLEAVVRTLNRSHILGKGLVTKLIHQTSQVDRAVYEVENDFESCHDNLISASKWRNLFSLWFKEGAKGAKGKSGSKKRRITESLQAVLDALYTDSLGVYEKGAAKATEGLDSAADSVTILSENVGGVSSSSLELGGSSSLELGGVASSQLGGVASSQLGGVASSQLGGVSSSSLELGGLDGTKGSGGRLKKVEASRSGGKSAEKEKLWLRREDVVEMSERSKWKVKTFLKELREYEYSRWAEGKRSRLVYGGEEMRKLVILCQYACFIEEIASKYRKFDWEDCAFVYKYKPGLCFSEDRATNVVKILKDYLDQEGTLEYLETLESHANTFQFGWNTEAFLDMIDEVHLYGLLRDPKVKEEFGGAEISEFKKSLKDYLQHSPSPPTNLSLTETSQELQDIRCLHKQVRVGLKNELSAIAPQVKYWRDQLQAYNLAC